MLDIFEIEPFPDLGEKSKERLREVATLLTIERGEMIFHPGDPSDCVYAVADGRVRISNISESGKELTLGFLEAGELFGELSLLDEHRQRAMATAVLPSKIWAIPREEFISLARSSASFAIGLSTIIGRRRHELEDRMESLVFHDVPARLAHQLLKLAEQYGMEKDGKIEITFRLTQLELANLIGATRETTSTALNDMKRAGILETSHKTIVIRDAEALREIEESI